MFGLHDVSCQECIYHSCCQSNGKSNESEWPVNICTTLDLDSWSLRVGLGELFPMSNMLWNVMYAGKFSESNDTKQFPWVPQGLESASWSKFIVIILNPCYTVYNLKFLKVWYVLSLKSVNLNLVDMRKYRTAYQRLVLSTTSAQSWYY